MQEVSIDKKQHIRDLKEVLGTKDAKIKELLDKNDEVTIKSTQTSLLEELNNAESEIKHDKLKERIGDLEKKLKDSDAKSKVRMKMIEKMKLLEQSNKDNLEMIETKIRMLANSKKLSKCRFGVECYRKFCQFDHSFVYRKVNTKQSLNFSCNKCDFHLKTEGELADHLGKHEHEQLSNGKDLDESEEASSRLKDDEDPDKVDIIDDELSDSHEESSISSNSEVSDIETQTESENGEV